MGMAHTRITECESEIIEWSAPGPRPRRFDSDYNTPRYMLRGGGGASGPLAVDLHPGTRARDPLPGRVVP